MNVYHFLGLIMHQPEGNLLDLLNNSTKQHEAKQILLAYQRPLDYAERYPDEARFCVCFSGVLLEQLQDPELIDRCRTFINIPKMLERYAAAPNIELAGTGYYHPLFPLIPQEDWDDHILRGRDKVAEVFGRTPLIFWPPELGLSRYMIPAIVKAGYRQVLCEGLHVRPEQQELEQDEIYYHTFLAKQSGAQIELIPRCAFFSNAQQGGTNSDWFCAEVEKMTSNFQCLVLVTTLTDGENGGWFRVEDELQQFWGRFFEPYMEKVKANTAGLRPTSLADFLNQHPPKLNADVVTGTWEYDPSKPYETIFENWAKTKEQQAMKEEIYEISKEVNMRLKANPPSERVYQLNIARDQILRAEASDNFYFHNGWLWKSRNALERARELLTNTP